MRNTVLFLLLALPLSLMAQKSLWKKTKFAGDELMGEEAYTAYSIEKSSYHFVFWDNSNSYRINALYHIFDYDYSSSAEAMVFKARVGFYDTSKKLLEGKDVFFYEEDGGAYPLNTYSCDVVEYITEKKGYVRIVAPLYNTAANYDIWLPCFNNAAPASKSSSAHRPTPPQKKR